MNAYRGMDSSAMPKEESDARQMARGRGGVQRRGLTQRHGGPREALGVGRGGAAGGELVALAASLEHLAKVANNPAAKMLADTLDQANAKFLESNKCLCPHSHSVLPRPYYRLKTHII